MWLAGSSSSWCLGRLRSSELMSGFSLGRVRFHGHRTVVGRIPQWLLPAVSCHVGPFFGQLSTAVGFIKMSNSESDADTQTSQGPLWNLVMEGTSHYCWLLVAGNASVGRAHTQREGNTQGTSPGRRGS